MRKSIRRLAAIGAVVAGLAGPGPALADVIITCQGGAQAGSATLLGCVNGSAGQPGEVILFNTGTTVTGGSSIVGVTNQTSVPILFTTTGDTFAVNSGGGGQATVTASDGFLNDLTVQINTPPGGNFTTFVYNIDAAGNGTIQFIIQALSATLVAETFTSANFSIDAAGQNFFKFEAINGEVISSISFTSTDGVVRGATFDENISSITQPRIAVVPGTSPVPVPEPASLALFCVALLGMAAVRRRKRDTGPLTWPVGFPYRRVRLGIG